MYQGDVGIVCGQATKRERVAKAQQISRRGRFIAASADLSASGKPTTYPDYFVKTHYRPRWMFR